MLRFQLPVLPNHWSGVRCRHQRARESFGTCGFILAAAASPQAYIVSDKRRNRERW